MRASLTSVASLAAAGLIAEADRPALERVALRYAIAVTPTMRDLIQHPADPIGRQFIPTAAELIEAPHENSDPTSDAPFTPVAGVVHRHPDRALLKPLLACPVYCRFCFRREHVGPGGGMLSADELTAAIAYIAAHREITEVILTGGDPLLLSPRRLATLLGRLAAIPHVEILRIHTRVPLVAPGMVTKTLAAALATEKPLWMVLHANHAREFTEEARVALGMLRRALIPLLGQSVLLRGVNDDEAALEALFRAMLGACIKPYYLHQLDAAPGTAGFAVPIERGRALLAALRARMTGLALPTYVLDLPGGAGKTPLGPATMAGV